MYTRQTFFNIASLVGLYISVQKCIHGKACQHWVSLRKHTWEPSHDCGFQTGILWLARNLWCSSNLWFSSPKPRYREAQPVGVHLDWLELRYVPQACRSAVEGVAEDSAGSLCVCIGERSRCRIHVNTRTMVRWCRPILIPHIHPNHHWWATVHDMRPVAGCGHFWLQC